MHKEHRLLVRFNEDENSWAYTKHLVYFDDNGVPVRYHKRSKYFMPGIIAFLHQSDPIWQKEMYYHGTEFPKVWVEPQIENRIADILDEMLKESAVG